MSAYLNTHTRTRLFRSLIVCYLDFYEEQEEENGPNNYFSKFNWVVPSSPFLVRILRHITTGLKNEVPNFSSLFVIWII